MEFLNQLTQNNIAIFLLLFLRFSGLFAFFPFFGNQLISVNIKGALIFFCTILFFPLVPSSQYDLTLVEFMIAGGMEILLGFCVGLVLQFVFHSITFGGDLISFTMGLTMASAYDPVSGVQKPIIAQVIAILALVLALSLDFHHILLILVAKSFNLLPLGTFILSDDLVNYSIQAFTSMLIVGFTMAFPVIAVLLLSDVIFGMIMKTNPQFNLLAVGFPVKIAIGFVVLIIVVGAMMYHFQNELFEALKMVKVILHS